MFSKSKRFDDKGINSFIHKTQSAIQATGLGPKCDSVGAFPSKLQAPADQVCDSVSAVPVGPAVGAYDVKLLTQGSMGPTTFDKSLRWGRQASRSKGW